MDVVNSMTVGSCIDYTACGDMFRGEPVDSESVKGGYNSISNLKIFVINKFVINNRIY